MPKKVLDISEGNISKYDLSNSDFDDVRKP